MILYGIPSCDTCRKARKALESAGFAVEFRDVRTNPLSEAERDEFVDVFGEALLNRRSTTWRGLSEEARGAPPTDLLAEHPTLMKRPILRDGAKITLGWDAKAQSVWLG